MERKVPTGLFATLSKLKANSRLISFGLWTLDFGLEFTECAECNVPLVHELPEDTSPTPVTGPDGDLVPVFSTYNPAEVMMVKSLLDAEEIVYNFQGELFKGSGVFIVPAMLFVAKAEARKVAEILEDHGMG
ncbi:MAG: hypothetical protein RRA32_10470 [bacterium]|nr:hypothetical protein [bacterium]